MQIKKLNNPLINMVTSSLLSLPSPSALSYFWNFGSLLGMALGFQLLTGIMLAMTFSADSSISFSTVTLVSRDCASGWMIRMAHANGASMFFFFLYMHIGRGIYYMSYNFTHTWMVGVVIFLLIMGTAFLGYVLPWGQMSFWGASVITGLLSAIPGIGSEAVIWLWGNSSVDNPVLLRFFSLHFLLPFIISAFSLVHLVYLHETGSSNPLGLSFNVDKIFFHPYFTFKDLAGFLFSFMLIFYTTGFAPWTLGDPENFIMANPMSTPVHIKPEWYFLFAYAILRSIPSKLGGVLALLLSVLMLFFFTVQTNTKFRSLAFYGPLKLHYWFWVVSVILLTWIGARPVEEPYIFTGQVLSLFYFSFFFSHYVLIKMYDKIV